MADETNNKPQSLVFSDKNNRDLMNKLRDMGKAYLTQGGKLIPAKKPPEIYCYCPQFCHRKLTKAQWRNLFEQFYSLADQNKQNQFLKTYISVHFYHNSNRSKRQVKNKRRVSCKYMVPDLEDGQHINQYKPCEKVIQVCQKTFVNAFGISEKRIRIQRERRLSEFEHESSNTLLDDQPLDLTNRSDAPQPFNMDKTKLYELAQTLGVSREAVDREMISRYEKLQTKEKHKDFTNIRGISEQIVGFQDNLAILPMQTLNNGDLTITPLLGPVAVENNDIMTVNMFFQNQLWRPELIGLHTKSESPIFI